MQRKFLELRPDKDLKKYFGSALKKSMEGQTEIVVSA
jgi:hypothetical protein